MFRRGRVVDTSLILIGVWISGNLWTTKIAGEGVRDAMTHIP
uniref:Uncharacterized protein n=1 Tax=Rhizophora mucronata TaxID=61149 RepID=A0A2P2R4T9_RHIMU